MREGQGDKPEGADISTAHQPDGGARHPRDTLDRPPKSAVSKRDREGQGEARIGDDG